MIGKLIPAGTGLERYRSVKLSTDNKQVPSEEDFLSLSEDIETEEVVEETVEETIEVTE